MADLVLYHANCADGFTAAWVAYLKFGSEADYLPVRYGDPPPDVTGRDVLIVDFSYPRAALLEMHAKAKSLRVLDHHRTAATDLEGLDFCVFDMDRSGAGITWDELHGGRRPAIVDYVEDRDLWRWKLLKSHEISAWLSSWEFDFEQWDALEVALTREWPSCVSQGQALLRGIDRYVENLAEQARRVLIGGHDVPIINTTHCVSELVGKLAEGEPFAVGWFQRQDGQYVYSLRSREPGGVDVSEVARQFGGGGHRNAAGFTLGGRIDQ